MGRGARASKAKDADTFVIRDVKTLKILADPLRHEMLALLDKPRTVKELADRIGRPPDRLYYHLAQLEGHGLVVADEQRGAERRYRLSAEHLIIDPDLTMPPGVAAGIVGTIFQRAQREYAAAVSMPKHAGKKRSTIAMQHVRLTEEERADVVARLTAILREYEGRPDDEGDNTFGILVGMWPVAPEDER